jgi:predicted hydrocarbon binding protein
MYSDFHISGDNLLHALDYVKRKKGADGLMGVVSETGQAQEDIFPDKMYPLRRYIELLEIIQRKFQHTDSNVIYRLGFDRAKNLSIFEYYKKKSEPITIFKLIEKNWSRFNDFGNFQIREKNDNMVSVYLCDFPTNPLYCQRMKGFFKAIISAICQMKDAKVEEEKCQSRNEDYCKFNIQWTKSEKVW